MAETYPAEGIDERAQHDVDEMDDRLERLEDRIADARTKAESRRDDTDPDELTGDWEDTDTGPANGDDPSGFDDPEAEVEDEDDD
jgi:hypothetical protein